MRKKLLAALALLFVLAAAYVLILKLPQKSAENEIVESAPLFHDFEAVQIELENEFGRYKLELKDGSWVLGEDEADGNYISSVLSMQGIILPEDIDKAACGLENARAKAVLTDKDGKSKTFLVGAEVSDASGVYVMTDKVYIADKEIAQRLKNHYNQKE